MAIIGSGGSAVSSDFGVSYRNPSVSGLADISRLSFSSSMDFGLSQPATGRKNEGSVTSDLSRGTLRPQLIVICTSDSRLELTVTPPAIKAILTYYKVCLMKHNDMRVWKSLWLGNKVRYTPESWKSASLYM